MNHSEQINELAGALAKAQGLFPDIPRNRSVTVTMKSGGKYDFKYATLDAILDAVRKPLSENGLSLTCYMSGDDKGELCTTRLLHSSGQWIECSFPLIVDGGADAQRWGSALTYSKRNAISAILAIHADEDDDGATAGGHESAPASHKPRTYPTTTPKQKTKTTPDTDSDKLSAIYSWAETMKQDSGKLLAACISAKVVERLSLLTKPNRRVAELFLVSCLSDTDQSKYFDYLLEKHKANAEELNFIGLQLPKHNLSPESLAALIQKNCDYQTKLMEAK